MHSSASRSGIDTDTDAMPDEISSLDAETDITWVNRDRLCENDYNPVVMSGVEREVLKQSLLDNGWTRPLIVTTDYTLVDGESRWFVSRHPDIRENESLTPDGVPAGHVPVFVTDADEKSNMGTTFQMNHAVGEHDTAQLATVLNNLNDTDAGLERLEMDAADLDVATETETDVSDVDFTAETERGAFTEQIAFTVSDADAIRDTIGEVTTETLTALARFIIETELYRNASDADTPCWEDIPDSKPRDVRRGDS